jgi:hypothetical protein
MSINDSVYLFIRCPLLKRFIDVSGKIRRKDFINGIIVSSQYINISPPRRVIMPPEGMCKISGNFSIAFKVVVRSGS